MEVKEKIIETLRNTKRENIETVISYMENNKFSEVDIMIAIAVQATTNFFGCYLAMWFCERVLHKRAKVLY